MKFQYFLIEAYLVKLAVFRMSDRTLIIEKTAGLLSFPWKSVEFCREISGNTDFQLLHFTWGTFIWHVPDISEKLTFLNP